MPLRLTWSRTWPDRAEDFTCHHGDVKVGRIYSELAPRGEGKRWQWATSAYLPQHRVQLTGRGIEATKQEAAEAVEASYFAALERLR